VDRHERRHLHARHCVPGGPAHDVHVAPRRREPVEYGASSDLIRLLDEYRSGSISGTTTYHASGHGSSSDSPVAGLVILTAQLRTSSRQSRPPQATIMSTDLPAVHLAVAAHCSSSMRAREKTTKDQEGGYARHGVRVTLRGLGEFF
jgi:hypothetical protein